MLINMRNALMAGGGLSAKSYVQDGLVAMWDGIENAGWGVHDANATTWKDLIGANNLTLNQDYSDYMKWEEAALVEKPRGNAKTVVGSKIQDMKFFEIVLEQGLNTTADISWACNGYVNGQSMLLWSYKNAGGRAITYNYTVKQTYPSGTFTDGERMSLSYGTDTPSILQLYKNGISVTPYSWADGWAGVLSNSEFLLFSHPSYNKQNDVWCRIFCVRAYSRAMTAAEIAANYAVDKARFNLPDAT